MALKISILFSLTFAPGILLPVLSFADPALINCNGRWTNGKCEETQVKGTLSAIQNNYASSPIGAKEGSEKRSLFHELNMKNIKSERELSVDIDITSAEELCVESSASLKDCRAEIEKLEERLDKRILAAAELNKSERNAERVKKVEKEEVKEKTAPDSQTTIIVRDNYPYYRRRYRRDRYPRDNNYGAGNFGVGVQLQQQNIQQNIIVPPQRERPTRPAPTPQSSGASKRIQ